MIATRSLAQIQEFVQMIDDLRTLVEAGSGPATVLAAILELLGGVDGEPDRIRDQQLAGASEIRQAGGEVHALAGHRIGAVRLAADAAGHHIADRDADMHLELAADLRREPGHGAQHRQRGAQRALDIVATGHRRTEQHHGAIADMLGDGAAVPLGHRVDRREEIVQERPRVLGAQLGGQAGEAGQVHEQHRHPAPFRHGIVAMLRLLRAAALEGRAAAAAEPRSRLVGEAAAGTGVGQAGATDATESAPARVLGAAPLALHGTTMQRSPDRANSSGRRRSRCLSAHRVAPPPRPRLRDDRPSDRLVALTLGA